MVNLNKYFLALDKKGSYFFGRNRPKVTQYLSEGNKEEEEKYHFGPKLRSLGEIFITKVKIKYLLIPNGEEQ